MSSVSFIDRRVAQDFQDAACRDLRLALSRLMTGIGLADVVGQGGVAILVADPGAPMVLAVASAESAPSQDPDVEGLWVAERHGLVRVAIGEIDRIEAAKDYVLLHTAKRRYIHRITMNTLERELDPRRMLRVHRSAFVNPDRVEAIRRLGRGLLSLVMRDGVAVPVGPSYVKLVQERLGLAEVACQEVIAA